MANELINPSRQKQIDVICEKVAEGLTIRQIAVETNSSCGTILRWIGERPEFVEQYERARLAAADIFEADIHDAAMNATAEDAAAARVKVDALKWIAARRAPKKYGDKVQQEHSGAVQVQTITRKVID
jgi:hypothetical protein